MWALQLVDRLTPVQSHPGVHTRVSTDYDTHPDSRDVNVKRMGTLELTADIFVKIGYKVEGYFHQRPGIIKESNGNYGIKKYNQEFGRFAK